MIPFSSDSLRLFLHVLAASVWVGGQIVLGGLVPQVRRSNPEALTGIARAFSRVAWPSLAVAVATGMWNILSVSPSEHGTDYTVTLGVKVALVALASLSTLAHSMSRSRVVMAAGGAISLVASLTVMYLGVLLTTAG